MKVALIAHDNCKSQLQDWVWQNVDTLKGYNLCYLSNAEIVLPRRCPDQPTPKVLGENLYDNPNSGGILQVAADIVNGVIDVVVLFWDPSESCLYNTDIKALLRIALVHDIPIAFNQSTANLVIKSPLTGKSVKNNSINEKKYGEAANKIGLPDIIDEFSKENAALIERYQAGFDSLLDVLAGKVAKQLKKEHDPEILKQALKETFKDNKPPELNDSQKQSILKLLVQMYTRDELNTILDEQLEGKTIYTDVLAEKVNKVDWRFDRHLTAAFLKEYFESLRENWEKMKAAKAQQEAEELDKN